MSILTLNQTDLKQVDCFDQAPLDPLTLTALMASLTKEQYYDHLSPPTFTALNCPSRIIFTLPLISLLLAVSSLS